MSGKSDSEQQLAKLGDAIRAQRAERGLSQEALADAAGMDRSHMGQIERGLRNVTFLNLVKIADALDRKPSEVLAAAGL